MAVRNMAGFVAPAMVAYLLAWTGGNWEITFYVSAAIYFVASLSWLFIDPVTPLDQETASA